MIYGWWPDKLQRDAARWVSRAAALGCLTFGTGALLRDDVANGFEALFIIARSLAPQPGGFDQQIETATHALTSPLRQFIAGTSQLIMTECQAAILVGYGLPCAVQR